MQRMGRASRRHRARPGPSGPAPGLPPPIPGSLWSIRPIRRARPCPICFHRRASAQGASEDVHRIIRHDALEAGFVAPSSSRIPDPACCVPVRHRVPVAARHPLLRDRVLGVVLLAPSTGYSADEDPDVLAMVPHARHFGYGVVEVRWLFGVPVTCAIQLASFADPVQPDTDEALDEPSRCHVVVAAWGADGALLDALLWDRVWAVGTRLQRMSGRGLQCLDHDGGYPSSPSEVSSRVARLRPFPLERIPSSACLDTPDTFGGSTNSLPFPA